MDLLISGNEEIQIYQKHNHKKVSLLLYRQVSIKIDFYF